jgi:hypothetical protein
MIFQTLSHKSSPRVGLGVNLGFKRQVCQLLS